MNEFEIEMMFQDEVETEYMSQQAYEEALERYIQAYFEGGHDVQSEDF